MRLYGATLACGPCKTWRVKISSAKYANNHNKLVSTRAGLTIGVFDAFQW